MGGFYFRISKFTKKFAIIFKIRKKPVCPGEQKYISFYGAKKMLITFSIGVSGSSRIETAAPQPAKAQGAPNPAGSGSPLPGGGSERRPCS